MFVSKYSDWEVQDRIVQKPNNANPGLKVN